MPITDLNIEADEMLGKVNKAILNTAIQGWSLVTSGTPVLTGRARASWLLTVDQVDNTTKSHVGGTKRVYSDPKKPKVQFDITKSRALFITNNVEYIVDLEDGTPYYDPFAMVAMAVPVMERSLTRRLNNIK